MSKQDSFFINQLKKLMFEKNLTQKELASLAKTKQQRISEWLTGSKKPTLSSIEKLANTFKINLNYFIENYKDNKPKNDINTRLDRLENLGNKILEEIKFIKLNLNKR